jgi:putative hydrolase of the HAD superfamily
MSIQCLLVDLDGTIYPASNGLWQAIKARIDLYLHEKMGFPAEGVPGIRQNFLDRYGTTLRGLQVEYQVNAQDFLGFVHDLPLEKYLSPNPPLGELFRLLKVPAWIFTNSDLRHSRRVLSYLGLDEYFSGVIDIHTLNYLCKPNEEAYRVAMEKSGCLIPEFCLFIDDSPVNIKTASSMGFQTVLIAEQPVTGIAHHVIQDLTELRDCYPDLFSQNGTQPYSLNSDE